MSLEPQPLARTRKDRSAIIMGLVAVAVALAALFYALQTQRGETLSERAEKVDLAQQVRAKCLAGGTPAAELGGLCDKARLIAGPAGPRGPRGPKGDPGKDGHSPESFKFEWDGVVFVCTPNPPGSPNYDCEPET